MRQPRADGSFRESHRFHPPVRVLTSNRIPVASANGAWRLLAHAGGAERARRSPSAAEDVTVKAMTCINKSAPVALGPRFHIHRPPALHRPVIFCALFVSAGLAGAHP